MTSRTGLASRAAQTAPPGLPAIPPRRLRRLRPLGERWRSALPPPRQPCRHGQAMMQPVPSRNSQKKSKFKPCGEHRARQKLHLLSSVTWRVRLHHGCAHCCCCCIIMICCCCCICTLVLAQRAPSADEYEAWSMAWHAAEAAASNRRSDGRRGRAIGARRPRRAPGRDRDRGQACGKQHARLRGRRRGGAVRVR